MDPPKCQQVTLQTIDVNNNVGTGSAYVSIDDIKNISACNFVNNNNTNIITDGKCSDGFMVRDETRVSKRREKRYKKINKKLNKKLKKLYKNDGDDDSSSDSGDSDGDSSSKKYKNKNQGHNIMMPDDIFLKIFILSFGALWVYIALKLMANMYKKR